MEMSQIEKYHRALTEAKDSPSQVALVQIELAGQAGYLSEQLAQLRNRKPEFFVAKKKEKDPATGKVPSNETVEMMWQVETGGKEIALKSDIEILDRFLTAAKACLISLSIESKVQE